MNNLTRVELVMAMVARVLNIVEFYKDEDGQWRWRATLAGGDTFGAPLYMEQAASETVRDILTITVSVVTSLLGRM